MNGGHAGAACRGRGQSDRWANGEARENGNSTFGGEAFAVESEHRVTRAGQAETLEGSVCRSTGVGCVMKKMRRRSS
jgi:hypothetical protein